MLCCNCDPTKAPSGKQRQLSRSLESVFALPSPRGDESLYDISRAGTFLASEVMMRSKVLLSLLLVWTVAFVSAVAQRATADAQSPPTTNSAGAGGYVGNDVCLGCHEDQHKRFRNTVMGKIFNKPRTPLEA